MNKGKSVVIVGGGPAGLTAAYELLKGGATNVVVLEAGSQLGGISKTVVHNGNRIDIGGHRFFSKSDWVMRWWCSFLPLLCPDDNEAKRFLQYRGQHREMPTGNSAKLTSRDDVMLVRSRLSRIYFNRRFFSYPLAINLSTIRKLGFLKTFLYGLGYVKVRLLPVKPERTLEDFFINRFGRGLYKQFFKSYTEKVWGVPCSSISADWGAQRVKSLSVTKALLHSLKKGLGLGGKAEQTSLIESFIYPKYGPGQMWEVVAQEVERLGGRIVMNTKATQVRYQGGAVVAVSATTSTGQSTEFECDYVISTMPVKELIAISDFAFTDAAKAIAANLQYRDFITVGLLFDEDAMSSALSDNWIYIQEPDVQVGRIQIFNNWSEHLVAKPGKVWVGLEYFCDESDDFWALSDADISAQAQQEIAKLGLVTIKTSEDAVVLRVPKAYPGYFGEAYANFDTLRAEVDRINNLFLVGRNGMHRYNNQDHSMLTAKLAAEQIVSGVIDKKRIWSVNVDDSYHESDV